MHVRAHTCVRSVDVLISACMLCRCWRRSATRTHTDTQPPTLICFSGAQLSKFKIPPPILAEYHITWRFMQLPIVRLIYESQLLECMQYHISRYHERPRTLAHLIPVDTTPSHAHNQRLKPWSPLNPLLTHVILVRVACGFYIRTHKLYATHLKTAITGQCSYTAHNFTTTLQTMVAP